MLAATLRRSHKWQYLQLSSKWDRAVAPIYEAEARGAPVPLLKVLLSSRCQNECIYCALRAGGKWLRCAWRPHELTRVTLELHQQGVIKGLFLSSAVERDPDFIVEQQLEVLRLLRKSGYEGYIHLRLMPGVSRHLIKEAVELADRVGVNLEGPTSEIFNEICPGKGDFRNDLIKRLVWIAEEASRASAAQVRYGRARAGVDTQFVVGAVPDTDEQYLRMTSWLYSELRLSRVYYSGFEPIPGTPLEGLKPCNPSREYRLYQASFLLRDYGLTFEDLRSVMEDGFLPNMDPKLAYAHAHPELFPIDLNDATKTEIMRIPGVGSTLADAIIATRERKSIRVLGDIEEILGPRLARRVAPYVALQGKRLQEWLKPE